MAGLTDFFVATPAEVAAADLALGPADRFPTVRLTGVDVVKIARLEAILTGRPYGLEGVVPLGSPDPAGPWTFPLRPALTRALAGVSDARAEVIGREWAATPEWVADRVEGREDAVAWMVRRLAELARRAPPDGGLYLWWSL